MTEHSLGHYYKTAALFSCSCLLVDTSVCSRPLSCAGWPHFGSVNHPWRCLDPVSLLCRLVYVHWDQIHFSTGPFWSNVLELWRPLLYRADGSPQVRRVTNIWCEATAKFQFQNGLNLKELVLLNAFEVILNDLEEMGCGCFECWWMFWWFMSQQFVTCRLYL